MTKLVPEVASLLERVPAEDGVTITAAESMPALINRTSHILYKIMPNRTLIHFETELDNEPVVGAYLYESAERFPTDGDHVPDHKDQGFFGRIGHAAIEMHVAEQFIADRHPLGVVLKAVGVGYSRREVPNGSETVMVAPKSAQSITGRYASLGIKDRKLVDFSGALATPQEVVENLSAARLVVATDDPQKLHDRFVHVLPYALVDPDLFEMLRHRSCRVLDANITSWMSTQAEVLDFGVYSLALALAEYAKAEANGYVEDRHFKNVATDVRIIAEANAASFKLSSTEQKVYAQRSIDWMNGLIEKASALEATSSS